jgi:hypothetical protein
MARLAAMVLAAVLSGTAAAGQQTDDTAAVAVAVLAQLRGALPAGPAAIDPEPFCTGRLVGWSCPARVREAVQELGLSLNSREFSLVCPDGPASCRLVSVASLVAFSGVEIDWRAGRARVTVEIWSRTPGAATVVHSARRLVLTRERSGWRIAQPDR